MRHVVLFPLVFAIPTAALACSCMGPRPVCSEFYKTPLVFYGRVISKTLVPGPPTPPGITEIGAGRFEVHFSVLETMRGVSSGEIVVDTSDAGSMCGVDFSVGTSYVVYATENPKWHAWGTGICTRTHRVADPSADEDLRWFHALRSAPESAVIYGNVINFVGRRPDSTGQIAPLAETRITISGPDSRTTPSTTAGEFRLEGLKPGRYTVDASPPEGFAAIDPVTVQIEAKGCAEVHFETRLDGHIRGHLYWSDGHPAGEVFMTARDVNLRFGDPYYSTTTGDGAFDFGPLTPGTYSFGVNADGFGVQPYSERAIYPESIQIGPSQKVADFKFTLPPDRPAPSVPITVRVVDRQGNPLPDATVLADNSIGPETYRGGIPRTDAGGKVTLVLRKGSYYDIWSYVNTPDNHQQCADPVGVRVDEAQGVELRITHEIGNCRRFRKAR